MSDRVLTYAAAQGSVTPFHDGPVNNVPKAFKGVFAPVLIVEIIGVFPYVECQNRGESLGYGIAGVGFLGDEELSVIVPGKPYPSGPEKLHSGIDEFLFEIVEGAELFVDCLQVLRRRQERRRRSRIYGSMPGKRC